MQLSIQPQRSALRELCCKLLLPIDLQNFYEYLRLPKETNRTAIGSTKQSYLSITCISLLDKTISVDLRQQCQIVWNTYKVIHDTYAAAARSVKLFGWKSRYQRWRNTYTGQETLYLFVAFAVIVPFFAELSSPSDIRDCKDYLIFREARNNVGLESLINA